MPNVEEIILQAMARGEFDDLPGAGKPLDLSAYFDTPEELRLAYSMLRNADILPQEAELLKEIAALREEAAAVKDSSRQARLIKAVEAKQLMFRLLMERQKRMSRA